MQVLDGGGSGDTSSTQNQMQTMIGTPQYLAPEVVVSSNPSGKGGYSAKVDIWSLGMSSIEMAEGHPPFYLKSPIEVLYALADPSLKVGLKEPAKWSAAFAAFVTRCMTTDDQVRRGRRMVHI